MRWSQAMTRSKPNMLAEHFANVERALLALRDIQKVTGHALHKGTPREALVQEFLRAHIGQTVAVGTGEVVSADSFVGEKRPQIDVVLYRADYPKLDFGGGVTGFLAESVVATVEVKSRLTYPGLLRAVHAASEAKALRRNAGGVTFGEYEPPSILSYVVAYAGPAQMETVYKWNEKAMDSLDIAVPALPASEEQRCSVACPALDGVFVLGRGFLQFDNSPLSFGSADFWAANPEARWCIGTAPTGSLLVLFLLLTTAVSGSSLSWLNPLPYVSSLEVEVQFGT